MTNSEGTLREIIAAQAVEYFALHRAGPLTTEDERDFTRWLRTSPVHVAEYLAVAQLAGDLQEFAPTMPATLDDVLNAAENETNVVSLRDFEPPFFAAPPLQPSRGIGPAVVGIAASIVALVAVWVYAYAGVLSTASGEQRVALLPDKTVMHLNENAVVKVSFDAHSRRIEIRRGEVYFDIAKDTAQVPRPFEVHVNGLVVNDIGTVFEVAPDKGNAVVTVVEGEVRVAPENGNFLARMFSRDGKTDGQAAVALTSGDQAAIADSGRVIDKARVDPHNAAKWVKKDIVFDGQPVASVANEFNRYNWVKIQLQDSEISTLPISGVFHTYDINSFAQFLANRFGVDISKTETAIIIKGGQLPSP